MSKVSVLLFYKRIFSIDRKFRVSLGITVFLIVAYFLSAAAGLIFATNPVNAQWKYWLPHTSISDKPFWLAMAVINISLDVVILAIPQTKVWKLQLSTRKKALVSLVFLLGALYVSLEA